MVQSIARVHVLREGEKSELGRDGGREEDVGAGGVEGDGGVGNRGGQQMQDGESDDQQGEECIVFKSKGGIMFFYRVTVFGKR